MRPATGWTCNARKGELMTDRDIEYTEDTTVGDVPIEVTKRISLAGDRTLVDEIRRATKRHDRQMNEANRPTGTELTQVSRRQGEQAEEIARLSGDMPVTVVRSGEASAFAVGTSWATVLAVEVQGVDSVSGCVVVAAVTVAAVGASGPSLPSVEARLLMGTDSIGPVPVPVMVSAGTATAVGAVPIIRSVSTPTVAQMQLQLRVSAGASFPADSANHARLDVMVQPVRVGTRKESTDE